MAHPAAEYDVFICHARGDVPLARALRAAVERMGRSAFAAEDDIRPGAQWHLAIPDAQDRSKVVAIVISRHWSAGHYNHGELATAIARYRDDPGRKVVPVLFDAVGREALPYGLETFAPLVGDRGAVDGVARGLLAAVDDARRVEMAEDLSTATTALEDLEASDAGADALAEARARVVQLKRALRAGGQLSPGDRLGRRYRLEEAVGDGGFATVWRAWDKVRKRRVAVKVLHPQHARDHSRRQRFVRGAHKMAAFDHPHIVPVLVPEADDDGFHYFVMAWMPGGDLRAAVLDGGLDRDRGRQVLLDVAAGLAAAHAEGLIHRDVKPGNVLIDGEGRARLSDFDLVRAPDTTGGTRTGGLGTTLFAAPEAFTRAKDADARADVYGLGMTAVFILLGRDLPGWVLRKPEKLIDELDCGPALKAALHRAVEFEADARWPSVDAFVEAVDRAWGEPSAPPGREPKAMSDPRRALFDNARDDDDLYGPVDPRGRTVSVAPRPDPRPPPARSRRLGLTLLGLLAFGLVSGGVGWLMAHRDEPATAPDFAVIPPPVDAAVLDAAIDSTRPVDAAADRAPPEPTSFRTGDLAEGGTRLRPPLYAFVSDEPARAGPPVFLMSLPSVTVKQFEQTFQRPSDDTLPARVTRDAAISYCNRLSSQEGRSPAYVQRGAAWRLVTGSSGYRLPARSELRSSGLRAFAGDVHVHDPPDGRPADAALMVRVVRAPDPPADD